MHNQLFNMSPSVENIPRLQASAVFVPDSSRVFRDDVDMVPVPVTEDVSYMPWGADNQMPYNVLSLIESDETLSTCQVFNAEVCYGGGLTYRSDSAAAQHHEVDAFFENNDIPSAFLGMSQDFKFFGFAVAVIILSADRQKIVRIIRKEACYCRFAPADSSGNIPYLLYANWRKFPARLEEMEQIPILSPFSPLAALRARVRELGTKCPSKFAVVMRIPTPDSTYYPIPYYASLFKGKWFNIKRLIATAKEAKLRNSAPIKYHIEISAKYWDSIFRAEGITDPKKQRERVVQGKQEILDFLTGVENSGKAWFSTFYITPDGKECSDVKISKIDSAKEGGDYETDVQEAINIICFTMRVHSNLVGSVPGKSQSNNSGSDKRELYTIAQALQRPYHDILFAVHRLIISFNGWKGFYPYCPILQLTTLDQHVDMREV